MTRAPTIKNIRIVKIEPDPDQPRKEFDSKALEALAASLDSEGLLQPIAVRPSDGTTPYMLIAGERRFRAASALGWKTIPAIVRDDITVEESRRLQLLENIVRQDLNPVEEARALSSMMDQGHSLKELSDCTGIVPNQILWRIQMLSARADVLDLVAKGHLKPSIAHALSRLSHDGQGRALRACTSEHLTYQEMVQVAERIWADENHTEMFPDLVPNEDHARAVKTFA